MARRDLNSTLRRLGHLAAVDQADRALRRSCIGRIVGALTGLFIAACLAIWTVLFVIVSQMSIVEKLPDVTSSILSIMFIGGLIASIVLAGLIGNLLRRQLWRMLRARRGRFL